MILISIIHLEITIFKNFEKEDKNFCYYESHQNIINFSALKLQEPTNNEQKFWIFVKILKFLDNKIEENYILVNNAFESNRRYHVQ